MPRKNSVKRYYENAYYHIYNRGVEKRNIFLDRQDYLTFLNILKTALSKSPEQGLTLQRGRKRQNFFEKINLLSYCLMPNHFHLLIRQLKPTSISDFMRSVCTAYGMYFNKKYKRVGPLFQGVFKAVDIRDEDYLLWVSRYIHRNPSDFHTYLYSSYADYLGQRNTIWLNTNLILDCFSSSPLRKINNYQKFVEDDLEVPIDLFFITGDLENDISEED